jgi:hypothetical protein
MKSCTASVKFFGLRGKRDTRKMSWIKKSEKRKMSQERETIQDIEKSKPLIEPNPK